MDNQRLILFIALSMVILLLWQNWEKEHAVPVPVAITQPETGVPGAPAQTRSAPAATQATDSPVVGKLESTQRVKVTTDVLQAEIDMQGGDLRHLGLRKHPAQADTPDEPFVLLDDSGSELFVAQSGLISNQGQWPNHNTRYAPEGTEYTLAEGKDTLEVPMTWSGADGLRVTKTYTFRRNSYLVDVSYRIRNGSRKEQEVYLYAQLLHTHLEGKGGMMSTVPSYSGGAIYTPEKKYEKVDFADISKSPLQRTVSGGWVAILQHYFVSAWMPAKDGSNEFYSRVQDGSRYIIGYKNLVSAKIAPGQEQVLASSLYAGPKEQKRLKTLAEGMTLTVDYGMLTVISSPLFWLLQYIHNWVGNWGWAIIILTILIKLVFYPLSAASYKSMAHMRRVQPKMQSIKERYGDDRQKMNQAMMELYKTEKINPLGGCLPILIQIPVFIALYWVLLESVEMRQAPFALWLTDLSSADPYFVLPLLMGVSMLAQQMLNPQPMDPLQKKVMMALPVVFTVFFAFFPAGLVLYWVVQNLLSIAQQWSITRAIEAGTKK